MHRLNKGKDLLKRKDRISGKDVDFISYLKKATYLKFSATKMYKISNNKKKVKVLFEMYTLQSQAICAVTVFS